MAAFQEILDVLPARYRTLDVSNVQELRLRAGQSPAVVENGAERRLAGLVRQEELSEILQRATQRPQRMHFEVSRTIVGVSSS